uniref:AAA+ ATPase domain-containing protein n=1 Tax=viral metagenome TaxID=1070528 RepID=A0A6C0E5U1_9ZZZZ
MKFYDTHYEEYIISNKKVNMHSKLEKIYKTLPKKISELNNIILYGPSGVGKYTQMLCLIKRYSPSNLKYEKKLTMLFDKKQFLFKISDIHYEIDMGLLGCNAKLLWHDIYEQIIDIISSKADKSGIIICKNFHEIHSELLENFYSYMQSINIHISLKFVIITEEVSFLPDSILNCCKIIRVPRPSKAIYNKCKLSQRSLSKSINLDDIQNIKELHMNMDGVSEPTNEPTTIKPAIKPAIKNTNKKTIVNNITNNKNSSIMNDNYQIICNKIIDIMKNYKNIRYLKFRETLYDLLIYNLNISQCVWYILKTLITDNYLDDESKLSDVLIKTYRFFQYYNNNYRPIYHIENYVYSLCRIIHGIEE